MSVRYEDVELGDDLPEETPDVSLDRVKQFVKSARLDFPRFTDHEFARREGLPGAIVPGIMSQALLSAMIHRWAPGCRVKKLDTVFRSPIVVGSSPKCSGAVTDTDDDHRTVEIDLTIVTDTGQTSVIGTAVVELA
jgi:acyl dehydratase